MNERRFCWYHNAEYYDIVNCTSSKNMSGNDNIEQGNEAYVSVRTHGLKQFNILDNMQC